MPAEKTYSVDEIFHEIPGDPDNVLMTIPEEICNELGWAEGDALDVSVEDGVLVMKKSD